MSPSPYLAEACWRANGPGQSELSCSTNGGKTIGLTSCPESPKRGKCSTCWKYVHSQTRDTPSSSRGPCSRALARRMRDEEYSILEGLAEDGNRHMEMCQVRRSHHHVTRRTSVQILSIFNHICTELSTTLKKTKAVIDIQPLLLRRVKFETVRVHVKLSSLYDFLRTFQESKLTVLAIITSQAPTVAFEQLLVTSFNVAACPIQSSWQGLERYLP